MRHLLFVILLATLGSCGAPSFSESELQTTSPDGQLSVAFKQSENGQITYTLTRNGKTVIANSMLGFTIEGLGKTTQDFEIEALDLTKGSEVYDLPWGEVAHVDAAYSEIELSLKHVPNKLTFSVQARLFAALDIRKHLR